MRSPHRRRLHGSPDVAVCKSCGYAVLHAGDRCAKCGAWLEGSGRESASRGGEPGRQTPKAAPSHALETALQAAIADPLGTRQADERAHAARQRVLRLITRLTAVIACLLLVLGMWHVYSMRRDRASLPIHKGTSWRFRVRDRTETVSLQIEDETTFKGKNAWLVSCMRNRDDGANLAAGQAFVVNAWGGLDLIGVQDHAVNLRLLPYPFPLGSDWTCRLGDQWVDPWKAICKASPQMETVQVPAGTYDALHVSVDVRAVNTSVATVDYWIARNIGPVKVRLDQRLADEIPSPMILELTEFRE